MPLTRCRAKRCTAEPGPRGHEFVRPVPFAAHDRGHAALSAVMPGLDPGIHAERCAMTKRDGKPRGVDSKMEAAFKRAAEKAMHGTREERSGRFLLVEGPDISRYNLFENRGSFMTGKKHELYVERRPEGDYAVEGEAPNVPPLPRQRKNRRLKRLKSSIPRRLSSSNVSAIPVSAAETSGGSRSKRGPD